MSYAPGHIWYACYGSNLRAERFQAYLCGGPVPDGTGEQVGALDPTLPGAMEPMLTSWELHFGRYSKRWEGAVAFILPPTSDAQAPATPSEAIECGSMCRLYRITFEQFVDVFLQENAGDPKQDPRHRADVQQALTSALCESRGELIHDLSAALHNRGWYRRLLHLGERAGEPVLTFTSGESLNFEPPSERYLRTIMIGLRQTYPELSHLDVARYLARSARAPIEDMECLAREACE